MEFAQIAAIAGLVAASFLWSGVRHLFVAAILAGRGTLDVPGLVMGSAQVLGGGLIGLAGGSLLCSPPRLPDRAVLIAWVAVVFATVLCIVVTRRDEVQLAPHTRAAQRAQGRWILAGAALATGVLMIAGYL